MVCSMARFMVRRKLDRFFNCSAISSATNWATNSGRLISSILILIRRPVRFCSSFLQLFDPLALSADQHAGPSRVEDRP